MAKLKQGAKIGPFPYRIVKTLGGGRGNMADVYLASIGEDDQADATRMVVIKISKAHSDHQEFFEDTIYNEAERLRRLNHPGIVRLLSIKLDSNMRNLPYRARADALPGKPWFLVLEYLSGGALDELLKREKKLDVGQALEIASDVAGTLDYLHRKNQVHLDIKPENILFRQPIRPGWPAAPVLIDFGISRHVGQKGLEAGTLYYIPPERVAVQKNGQAPERFASPQPAMDVYSLGVVLYQMLTGHRPFEGRTDKRISSAILESNPTMPSHYREELAPELDALVLKTMAKEPNDRPNAGDLALQLQELAGRYRYATPPAIPPRKPPGTVDPTGESNPRRPIRGALMGMLGVAILVAVLFSMTQPGISGSWKTTLDAMLSNIPRRGGGPITLAQTDTPTPPPTRTNTPTPTPPTPTSTPVPDRRTAGAEQPTGAVAMAAKSTDTPTATATRTPTRTPTVPPTSTPVPAKRKTPRTPTRTPTRKPTHTPTRTRLPAASATSTPATRKKPTPTHTPRPTATPRKIGARPTAAPKPTATPRPPAPAQAGIPADAKAWGFWPGDQASVHGRVEFRWTANFSPSPGQAFEAVFWRRGEDAMRDGKGWGGVTQGNSITLNWDKLDVAKDTYFWGVLLVTTDPYRRLKYLGGGNAFSFEGVHVNAEEGGVTGSTPGH